MSDMTSSMRRNKIIPNIFSSFLILRYLSFKRDRTKSPKSHEITSDTIKLKRINFNSTMNANNLSVFYFI